MNTFFSVTAAVGEGGGMGGVVGQVTVWLVGVVRGRRAGIVIGGGNGGGRRRTVVMQRREVPHARALLYDRSIRQPHPKQLHSSSSSSSTGAAANAAAAAGGARPGVVAVVAAVRAPPSHADSQLA